MRKLFLWSVITAVAVVGQVNAATVVEFDEVVLPSVTLLDGTTHYDPYGISFEDETFHATDFVYIGAGTDIYGLTSPFETNGLITVVFDSGASSVVADWVTGASTDIYADAYNSVGGLIDSQSAESSSDTKYGTFTFSGVGTIGKITFSGNAGVFGVGRLTYDLVPTPEPTTLTLATLGLLGMSWRRRKRA